MAKTCVLVGQQGGPPKMVAKKKDWKRLAVSLDFILHFFVQVAISFDRCGR